MDMKIRPLADRVLVKMEEVQEKTASGIFIPQTAQEKTQIATVVAVGDDTEAIKVKVGDKVMHDKYAGTSVKGRRRRISDSFHGGHPGSHRIIPPGNKTPLREQGLSSASDNRSEDGRPFSYMMIWPKMES